MEEDSTEELEVKNQDVEIKSEELEVKNQEVEIKSEESNQQGL